MTARRAEANAGDAPALGLNWNANAFAGATPQEALQALGISRSPETSRGFDLVLSEAPGEDGSPAVFALVNLEAREGAGVRRVALLVENLSPPLACVVDLNHGAGLPLRLPLKPADGGDGVMKVAAVAVMADGRVLVSRRELRPSARPGAGSGARPAGPDSAPVRMRVQLGDGFAVARAWLRHEMRAAGPQPAWHITEAMVQHGGRAALRAQCGPWLARDPVLQFALRGAVLGDRIRVSWLDNRGARQHAEGAVGH